MRILYSFPHPIGSSGIGTTAWQTVVALARDGHEVHVSTTSVARPFPRSLLGSVTTTMTIGGRRVPHRALGLRRAYARHDNRTARLVRRLRPDVVHTWPRSCLLTLTAGHSAGVPALRESPSPHSASAYEVAARAVQLADARLTGAHFHAGGDRRLREELAEYAAATAVLAPSGYAVQTFVARGHPPARVLQHRYGVDLEQFTVAKPPSGPLRVAFVGRIEPAKGVDELVPAWRDARSAAGSDSHLLLIGEDTSDARRRLTSAGPEHGVQWLGRRSDVPGILAGCHAIVLPSHSEGMALSVLEGMAVGLVPVVSDSSGAPVTDGVDGLVHRVGDTRTLAAHLLAIHDPARRRDLRQAVLDGRESLSWGAAARRLVECYEEAGDLGPPG